MVNEGEKHTWIPRPVRDFWGLFPEPIRWIVGLFASAWFAVLINWASEGRGPMILSVITAICVAAIAIYFGDANAKAKNARLNFWFWGAMCLVFSTTIFTLKYKTVQTYKSEMAATNQLCETLNSNLSATNTAYNKLLTNYNDTLDPQWRFNWFAAMARQFLKDRKYQDSVEYFELSREADVKINKSTSYSGHFITYYATAILMTNDTPETRKEYLEKISNNIAKLEQQNDLKQLKEVQGELGEMESLVSPNFVSQIKKFENEIADYLMNP